MIKIKEILLILFVALILTNCSSSDDNNDSEAEDNSNIQTPSNANDLLDTEWVFSDNGNPIVIYLGTPSNSALLDGGNIISQGTHTYDKPNLEIDFRVRCNTQEPEYIFNNCKISGIIEKDELTIKENGIEYTFFRLFEEKEDNTIGPEGENTIHPELLHSWIDDVRLGGITGTETITFFSDFTYTIVREETGTPSGNPFKRPITRGNYWFNSGNTNIIGYKAIGGIVFSHRWSVEKNPNGTKDILKFNGQIYSKL